MIKIPFAANPSASDFVPVCADNERLHDLACGRHATLTDTSAVREFGKKLRSANYIAIAYHQNTVNGELSCDFLSFRTRDRIFHYSAVLSRHFQKDIILALENIRNKPVIVYRFDLARVYLCKLLGWVPSNAIDAMDVAKDIGVRARLNDMSFSFTGGPLCTRGANFAAVKMPSQTALRHLDVLASFLYEFCVHHRGLRGGDVDADRGRPQRQHDEPRSNARNSARDSARSRSRV